MAKKSTKQNNAAIAQSVGSKAAAKVAERIFSHNPELKEVHITADGTAFYNRGDAQSHARSLQNHDVASIKRNVVSKSVSGAGSAAKANPSDIAQGIEDASTEAAEVDELTGEVIIDESSNTGE